MISSFINNRVFLPLYLLRYFVIYCELLLVTIIISFVFLHPIYTMNEIQCFVNSHFIAVINVEAKSFFYCLRFFL